MAEIVKEQTVTLEVQVRTDQEMAETWESLARMAASFSMGGREVRMSADTMEIEVHHLTVSEDE